MRKGLFIALALAAAGAKAASFEERVAALQAYDSAGKAQAANDELLLIVQEIFQNPGSDDYARKILYVDEKLEPMLAGRVLLRANETWFNREVLPRFVNEAYARVEDARLHRKGEMQSPGDIVLAPQKQRFRVAALTGAALSVVLFTSIEARSVRSFNFLLRALLPPMALGGGGLVGDQSARRYVIDDGKNEWKIPASPAHIANLRRKEQGKPDLELKETYDPLKYSDRSLTLALVDMTAGLGAATLFPAILRSLTPSSIKMGLGRFKASVCAFGARLLSAATRAAENRLPYAAQVKEWGGARRAAFEGFEERHRWVTRELYPAARWAAAPVKMVGHALTRPFELITGLLAAEATHMFAASGFDAWKAQVRKADVGLAFRELDQARAEKDEKKRAFLLESFRNRLRDRISVDQVEYRQLATSLMVEYLRDPTDPSGKTAEIAHALEAGRPQNAVREFWDVYTHYLALRVLADWASGRVKEDLSELEQRAAEFVKSGSPLLVRKGRALKEEIARLKDANPGADRRLALGYLEKRHRQLLEQKLAEWGPSPQSHPGLCLLQGLFRVERELIETGDGYTQVREELENDLQGVVDDEEHILNVTEQVAVELVKEDGP